MSAPETPSSSRARPRRAAHRAARRAAFATPVLAALLLGACGQGAQIDAGPPRTTPDGKQEVGADGATPESTDGNGTPNASLPKVETVAGMPPVVDPGNIYSEAGPGKMNPVTKDAVFRVYVPNEVSGTLTVIDPTSMKVLGSTPTGTIPQHVVPSYDMTKLYVLNNSSNTITPIDPLTGKTEKAIAVDDPYNLYYTPDGKQAIIVAEAMKRFDFADPNTFKVQDSLTTDCDGVNHLDFSADGRYFIATCEFNGTIIKVDTLTKKLVCAPLKLDIGPTGRTDTIKKITQPQDIRVSNTGKTFYVADLITSGIFVVDGETFKQTGWIKMGVGTHGLYPSRDGQKLYVVNRGTETIPAVGSFKGKGQGSVMVFDFATQKVEATWDAPGASPDMGNLTADGKQLWLGGRYDGQVYVFDTEKGQLIKRIDVGQNPHGLTVWPQPGRYSFGHTGNMR